MNATVVKRLKRSLISEAQNTYGRISPCGSHTDWEECFTIDRGELKLWFNTEDNSTHMVTARLFSNKERVHDIVTIG